MKRALCLVALAACADAREYHPAYCVTVEGGSDARVLAAALEWNAALGWDAVHVGDCPEGAFPVLAKMNASDVDLERWGGYFWMREGDYAVIYIPAGVSASWERSALLHELGHVMSHSEEHSEDEHSVMHSPAGSCITQEAVDAVMGAR